MPYSIRLPDGTLVENIPDDVPFAQARARIESMRPDLAKYAEQRQGFVPAVKAGVERLKGEAGLLAGKTGLMSLKEAEEYKRAKEAEAQRVFTPTTEGWTEAPWTKFKETLGGSLPYMAAPAAAGLAAAALPLTGTAATVAGLGAAGLASGAQFTGSNIARQMEGGKSLEEASLGKAALAAVPQAALDILAMRMIPGIGRIFGAAGSKVTAETAEQIAKQSLGKVAADYAKATGKAMTTEGLTEAAQQVFERLQAGLRIADPEARKEYFDSFLGGAVLGGVLAPAGRYVERATAKPEERPAPAQPPAPPPAAEVPAAPPPIFDDKQYEELVQMREQLRQLPQNKEVKQQIAQLTKLIRAQDIEFTKQREAERAQAKDEEAKAAASAFSQPDQEVLAREELDIEALRRGDQPAAEPTEIPEGAVTESDLDEMGTMGPRVRSWAMSNVVGKTPEQLQAWLNDTSIVKTRAQKNLVGELVRELTPAAPEVETETAPMVEPETEPAVAPAAQDLTALSDEELKAQLDALTAQLEEVKAKQAALGTRPSAKAKKPDLVAKRDKFDADMQPLTEAANRIREGQSAINEEASRRRKAAPAPAPAPAPEAAAQQAAAELAEETPAQKWEHMRLNDSVPAYDQLHPEARALVDAFIEENILDADATETIIDEHYQRLGVARPDSTKPTQERFPKPGELSNTAVEAIRNGNVRSALMEIATGSPTPLFRAVANRLLDFADPLSADGKRGVEVTIVPHVVRMAMRDGKTVDVGANGRAFEGGRRVELAEDTGLAERTLLHELLHSATLRQLLVAEKKLTPTQIAARQELQRLFTQAKQYMGRDVDPRYVQNLPEFVAYALSDPDLQAKLAEITYKPETSFWDAFKSLILRFLGVDMPRNVGEATIGATEALFAVPVPFKSEQGAYFSSTAVNPDLMARAEGIVHKPMTTKDLVASGATIVKDNFTDPIGKALAARTMVADRWATVEQRLQRGVDNVRKAGAERAAAMTIARQAEDVSKLLPSLFHKGKLVVDRVTRMLKVEDGATAPDQMFAHIRTLATRLGLSYEQGYAYASTIMEGKRLQSLLEKNKNLKAGEDEVMIHWRKPDGSIDYAGIKQAALEYDAHPEIKEVAKIMDNTRKSLINELIASGWIGAKEGAELRDVEYYVPFDRLDQDGLDKAFRVLKKQGVRGIAQVSRMPELKGAFDRPVGNVVTNYYKTISWLATELAKQNATTVVLEDMAALGYAKPLGKTRARAKSDYVVPLYKDGEQYFYELPTKYDYVAFLDRTAPKGWFVRNCSNVAGFLRTAITANPVFAMRQVAMDIQSALLLADIKNPASFVWNTLGNFASLSWYELKNIPKGAKGERIHHHHIEKFMADRGLSGEVDYTISDPALDVMFSQGLRKRTLLGSAFLGAAVHGFKQITHASDLAVRKALYDDTIRATKDEMLASTRARELINFRRRGAHSFTRDMVAMVPFLNAHIQSMDILWREATGKGASITGLNRAQAKARFIKAMGLYAGIATMYAMFRNGDEDYDNMDRRVRNDNWLFSGEEGGIRIPIRGDLGVIKVGIENAVDWWKSQGTPKELEAKEAVATALAYVWEKWAAPTLLPAALRPLAENMTNYSFLTGRPLEGTYQKTLMPHQRQTSTTSETSKGIATWLHDTFGMDVSPIMLDNALRGYFGTTGATVLGLTDMALNPDAQDRPLHKLMVVGAFAWDKAQLTQEKGEFYDLLDPVLKAKATFDDLKTRDIERARSFFEENKDYIMLAPMMQHTLTQLSVMRKAIKYLESPMARESMDADTIADRLEMAREQELKLVGYAREMRARFKL